jgi:hypothetical protein
MTAEVNGGENRLTGSKKEDLSLPEIFVSNQRKKEGSRKQEGKGGESWRRKGGEKWEVMFPTSNVIKK